MTPPLEPEPTSQTARQQRREAAQRQIDPQLRRRLRILSLIFLTILAVMVVEVLRGTLAPTTALLGLALGTLGGLGLSRMSKLGWDEAEGTAVAGFDWIAGVVLVLYLLFSFNRGPILSLWLDAGVVVNMTLSFVGGTLLGRVIGTTHGVRRLLRVWGQPTALGVQKSPDRD